MSAATATPARTRLLDAALTRFAADGALVATLDEIRREAGVSVGSLYHHFADKQALATALYVDVLAGYQDGLLDLLRSQPDPQQGISRAVRFHLRWCAEHRDGARFLLFGRGWVDEDAVQAASKPFLRDVAAWYATHAHHGAVRPLPFELVHALWLGPTQEYLRHWLPRARAARAVSRTHADELARAAWLALRQGDPA